MSRRALLGGAAGASAALALAAVVERRADERAAEAAEAGARADDPVPSRWSDRAEPVHGLLQCEPGDYPVVAAAGVGAVTVSVPWSRAEPERGVLAADVLDAAARDVESARSRGLSVALGPGLQYPPEWALDGPDGARFVDQHGREWHGEVGDDVADAVFDSRVREAQEDYLRRLGERLGPLGPAGIRLGGLARGELHYPFVDLDGPRDTLWCYGEAAQRQSPVPGLRPGEGSTDDMATLADWYLQELAGYGRWQLGVARDAFGDGPRLLVLLPSWGLRPGEVHEAVEAGLDGSTSGQQRGTLTEGLDWLRQVPLIADVPGADVCSTWMDTPDQGDDARYTSPVRYLSGLASPYGLGLWGENTGDNDRDDMRRCLDLVDELEMEGMYWMSAADLGEGGNATLADYAEELRRRREARATGAEAAP